MEKWMWTAVILCIFGLFKEFQPSAPFIVEYAVDYRNITSEVVLHDILPMTTYGQLLSVLVLLFITDLLRYKPIIFFGGFALVVSWIITIWSYTDQTWAQVRQIVMSMGIASDLAYFTYMYANVDRTHYQQVTSYTHSALHSGRFLGGVTSQLLFSTRVVHIDTLNYLSLGGVTTAFLFVIFLPDVKRSIYFYPRHAPETVQTVSTVFKPRTSLRRASSLSSITESRDLSLDAKRPSMHGHVGFTKRVQLAVPALWLDFKKAYSNRYVLKWSLWWSFATSIYLQVKLYSESLWKHIDEETGQPVYNGAVDATHAFLSAVLGLFVGYIKFPWFRWGEVYLCAISIVQGSALLFASQTHNLYFAYAAYIVFQTLYQVMIIIATAEVAEGINEDSEAFIFGLNTLLALLIQTVLTYTVTSESGFTLNIRDEFVVYGICSVVLGLIFFIVAIQNRSKHYVVSPMAQTTQQSKGQDSSNFTMTCRESA